MLDSMDIERERGITIKAQTVRLTYQAKNGETNQLNLMDTPGHVDFAYEVSRCLAWCAKARCWWSTPARASRAQTLANVYQAIDNHHEIVPILNKIDLPAAEPERVKQQIEDVIGIDAYHESGPANPREHRAQDRPGAAGGGAARAGAEATKCALESDAEIDSRNDAYLGVIILVRVVYGKLKAKQVIEDDYQSLHPPTSSGSACSRRSPKPCPIWGPAKSVDLHWRASRRWLIARSATP